MSEIEPGGGKSEGLSEELRNALDWEDLARDVRKYGLKARDMAPIVEAVVKRGIAREAAVEDVERAFRLAGVIK